MKKKIMTTKDFLEETKRLNKGKPSVLVSSSGNEVPLTEETFKTLQKIAAQHLKKRRAS